MDEQTTGENSEVKKETGDKNARFMAIIFAVMLIGGVCVLILLALYKEQPLDQTTNPTGSQIDTLGTSDNNLVPGVENVQFKQPQITQPNTRPVPSVPRESSISSPTPTQVVTKTPTPIPQATNTETPTPQPDTPTVALTPSPTETLTVTPTP